MPSTIQYYEWCNQGAGIESRSEDMDYQVPEAIDTEGCSLNIFNPVNTDGAVIGNKLSRTPVVGNNQFVVINKIGLSPYLQGTIDIKVNQTYYFQNPDGTTISTNNPLGNAQPVGISGLLYPYPCSAQVPSATGGITMPSGGLTPDYFEDDGTILIPISNKLNPPIYILAGQTFSFIYNTANKLAVAQGSVGPEQYPAGGSIMVFVSYTLHEGPEALLANQLLDMGIPITNNNIDWLKRETMKNMLYEVDFNGN